jgi:glycerol uptake facilitator-like aquaporin
MFSKQRAAILVAEFLGTAMLALTVLSVAGSNIGIPYFISLAAGLVLGLAVLTIGNISGAVINPAITVGLWSIKKLTTVQAITYIFVQFAGGIAAYGLYNYLSGTDLKQDVAYKPELLIAEAVGTAVFAFGIAAAVFNKLEGGVKAFAIGGSLTLGIVIASVGSSAFLNPAVALSAQSWELASYGLGPVLGAVLGFNLYKLLYVSSLETKVVATAKAPVKKKTTKKK